MVKHNKPKKLEENITFDRQLVLESISDAQYMLGVLEGSQKRLENPKLLLTPLITKEATVSSKIEGTQSTVTDVFAYNVGADSKNSDAKEVLNYRIAMLNAMKDLSKKKIITKSFLKSIHALLLNGVRRNSNSVLGDFRNKTVWIGKENSTIEEASYIPPEHFFIDEYMDDLVEYINSNNEKALIKSAVVHYQFEAIHPFDDGNGRIGRLLIPLMLCSDNQMTFPILYISGYFEKNKDRYIESLRSVDKTGDFTNWILFFCEAVKNQLSETQLLIDSIYDLHSSVKRKYSSTSYRYDVEFVDFIFRNPVFTLNDIQKEIKMNRLTARSLVENFSENNFIRESSFTKKRSKVYIFQPLIDILSK
jgi:Fic family protein